jgi:hypothetical protein
MNKVIIILFFGFLGWFFYQASLLQASLGLNVIFILYAVYIFTSVIYENYINKDEESDNGSKE